MVIIFWSILSKWYLNKLRWMLIWPNVLWNRFHRFFFFIEVIWYRILKTKNRNGNWAKASWCCHSNTVLPQIYVIKSSPILEWVDTSEISGRKHLKRRPIWPHIHIYTQCVCVWFRTHTYTHTWAWRKESIVGNKHIRKLLPFDVNMVLIWPVQCTHTNGIYLMSVRIKGACTMERSGWKSLWKFLWLHFGGVSEVFLSIQILTS